MGVFKKEVEYKRVIFNIRLDLAERLEQAKAQAAAIGKKLDLEAAVNKSLEAFLGKAEKKLGEYKAKGPQKQFKNNTGPVEPGLDGGEEEL
ncbi:MAG: hypothetical protein V1816_09910 [Pseudomonadota bacterium]